MTIPVTIAYGDGIGPEIMEATLHILREADAPLAIETIEVGARIYNMESKSGMLPLAWDSLMRTRLFLKAPTLLPEGDFQSVTDVVVHTMELPSAERYFYYLENGKIISANTPSGNPGALLVAATAIHKTELFALFETADAVREQKRRNRSNPSSMLLAAIKLLEHAGQDSLANRLYAAWQETMESGIHTPDIFQRGISMEKAGTREFAEAVAIRIKHTADKTALVS